MKRLGDRLCWGALALALSVLPSSPAGAQGPPSGVGVKVLNAPLAVTIVAGEQVNAFHQVAGTTNQLDNTVFTIPAGKRLVLDFVSAKADVPASQSVSAIFINLPVVHYLVVASQGTDAFGFKRLHGRPKLAHRARPLRRSDRYQSANGPVRCRRHRGLQRIACGAIGGSLRT